MWKKYQFGIWAWGSALAAIISAAKTAWELYTLIGAPGDTIEANIGVVFRWFILFVLLALIAIATRENELQKIKNNLPVIKLRNFDLEIKTWKNKPPCIAVYIEMKNEPHPRAINANAVKVYPQIRWEDLISGQVLEPNPGRWFIPNREREQIIELHTVNLEANGKAKKLHFGAIEKHDSCIRAIWRDDDDRYQESVFLNDHKHKITISLKDTKGAGAEFLFVLSKHLTETYPFYVFQLERIGKDGKVIGRPKRFELKDLPNKSSDIASIPLTKSS